MGWGGRWEGGDICVPMPDLCWCMAETNNVIILQLKINKMTNKDAMVKKKNWKKKKKKKSTETSSFKTDPSMNFGPWALSLPVFCPAHSSQKAETKKQMNELSKTRS